MYPENKLPNITLPAMYVENPVPKEQCKALTPDARKGLVMGLERDCDYGLSTGGVLMLGMARTAEAVAVRFRDITFFDDFCVVALTAQGDGERRNPWMKNSYSYRKTVMGYWHTQFFRRRKAFLADLGYEKAEIQEMYVASPPDNPSAMANPNYLSKYIKKILVEAGCDANFWLALNTLMVENPDLDENGKANLDPTAYILRRDTCTVLCNVCGLNPYLVDSMMGHCLPRTCNMDWPAFLRAPDNWAKLAQQLERMVYHSNFSRNPTLHPHILSVDNPQYVQSISQIGCILQADPHATQPITVTIRAQSTELDDAITVETDGIVQCHQSQSALDQSFEAIIGTIY